MPRTRERTQSNRSGKIAESIRAFGFTNPVPINSANQIIAGHGRVSAAKLLGMEQVPTIRLDSLTPDEIRAYIIADNRLAERAGWDKAILSIEFQHLLTLQETLDITLTGFEIPEVDVIIEEANGKQDLEEGLEINTAGPSVTQPGDLWLLGKHRVLCADSLHEPSFKSVMGGRRAEMVFTAPRTTSGLTEMSAGKARSATANSPWPRAKCQSSNSPHS